MFFVLSQILDFLATPSDLIALIGIFGLIFLALKRRRTGIALLSTAAVALIVFGFSPLGAVALGLLEDRFPAPALPASVTGIILLGGAVDTHISGDRRSPTLNDASERLTATMELANRFPAARVVLSGGGAHLMADGSLSESQVAYDVLVAMGLASTRIELEERSRNTCENATESKQLAVPQQGQQWILVTSASHMPRAVACFRAAGFEVIPYPVDYRTRGTGDLTRPANSIAAGLAFSDLAAHEWVGLLTYRLAGKTSELFPEPGAP